MEDCYSAAGGKRNISAMMRIVFLWKPIHINEIKNENENERHLIFSFKAITNVGFPI